MKKLASFLLFAAVLVSCQRNPFNGKELYATVEKFVSLGNHRTGTPTDTATSYWLGEELKASGYDVKYLQFSLRQFFLERSAIVAGADTIKAFPLWWVNDSNKLNASGFVVDSRTAKTTKELESNIVLTRLKGGQTGRKSVKAIDSLINAGAKAIIAITENQSGDITASNTSAEPQPWKVPVILIGPRDSTKVLRIIQNKQNVSVFIKGVYKNVTARNIYASLGKADKYIVVSTPISGWFGCGGERGPGVAIWLALAKWAAKANLPYTFVFTGNSGHELSGIGAHQFLEKAAPAIEKTHLWIHLGAGVATRAYEKTPNGLKPLETVDSLRSFFYSDSVKASFDKAFANIKAQKFNVAERNGGELVYVAKHGYSRILGVSHSHAFFHVPSDSASTTSPELLEEAGNALKHFIELEAK